MTDEMTSHGLTLTRREKINATGITYSGSNYNGSFNYKRG